MKTSILRIIAMLLVLLMVLSSCGPTTGNDGDDTTDSKPVTDNNDPDGTTEEPTTDAPTTDAPTTDVSTTEEPATEEPTTDASTTEEPTTEEPATEEPTTEEPTTEEPTTEEPTTEEPTTEEPVTDDPVEDDVPSAERDMKILMIGNSFCYYFVEELYAIAAADGYDLTVANLYEPGCSVREHWMNGVTNEENYYELWVTTSEGRTQVSSATSFDYALDYAEWDVISLQQHFYPDLAKNVNSARSQTKNFAKQLFNYIKTNNPSADLYWQQTWAYQVGYAVAEKYGSLACPSDTPIADIATQTTTYNNIKTVSQEVATENSVKLVPSGDAWQIARVDSRVGDNMCARLGTNDNLGDYYHDGDIGGGQYLNACVWYEVLTGESCVGNTWRPSDTLNYSLSDTMIAGLQAAAHQAVAAVYGADYAK